MNKMEQNVFHTSCCKISYFKILSIIRKSFDIAILKVDLREHENTYMQFKPNCSQNMYQNVPCGIFNDLLDRLSKK